MTAAFFDRVFCGYLAANIRVAANLILRDRVQLDADQYKLRLEEFAARLDEVGAELVGLPCCPAIIRRGGYFEVDSDSIEDIERAVSAMEELVNG